MTLNKLLTGLLVVQLVIFGTLVLAPAQTRTQPASAQQQSDKYDGDCTGQETQGRCADKCPPPTAEGVYFERGRGPNGQLACGFAYYNACPYMEGASATDPKCEKARLSQQPPEPVQDWGGK